MHIKNLGGSMGKYYAVRKGKTPGIYETWEKCKEQTEGFSSADFKSFKTLAEAEEYMGIGGKNGEETQLNISDKDTIIAYVDGSYNIATKEYGYGAVILTKDKEIELYEKGIDIELATMRNVAGEIKGAEAAMRYAVENNYKKVIIYYDYEGIEKWCTGQWKTNKDGTKEYKRIYDQLSKAVVIEFIKVKGHSGDKYNDKADLLAKKAAGVEY